MVQSLQHKTLLSGDDSAEVNLSFELKGKLLEVDAIRILNNYFLPVNHANNLFWCKK